MVGRLKRDLEKVGLPTDMVITLKGYSKTYEGRYIPSSREIILYQTTKDGSPISYSQVLDTAIHEAVHHIQWSTPDFTRYKGVMHDPEFWQMYATYKEKAEKEGLFIHKTIKIRRGNNENSRTSNAVRFNRL